MSVPHGKDAIKEGIALTAYKKHPNDEGRASRRISEHKYSNKEWYGH